MRRTTEYPFALLRASALATLIVLAAACGSNSVTNPQFQPEISNATDNFQFQATGVTNVSQTLSYPWQHTGTTAAVDQSGTLSAGSATLTILDASGTQVYTQSLTTTGSFVTSAGQSGAWTIRLVLSGVSGTLNFRVQ